MLIEGLLGYDSDNPTMVKEIGKSYLHKANLLTKFGQYKTALFKYYEAFQCFCYVIGYHSNASLSKKKKIHKEVSYLVVTLISITQLLYHFGHFEQGSEALSLLTSICRTFYKPNNEMNSYVANMIFFYETRHNRLTDERMQFERIIASQYKARFDPLSLKEDVEEKTEDLKDWLHEFSCKEAIKKQEEEGYYVALFTKLQNQWPDMDRHQPDKDPNKSALKRPMTLKRRFISSRH